MEQSSVWRAAEQMIRLYGTNASSRAAMRADMHFAQDDIKGFYTWKRIVTAIDDLRRPPPGPVFPV